MSGDTIGFASTDIYIYIYGVCVCERERERVLSIDLFSNTISLDFYPIDLHILKYIYINIEYNLNDN
jgi:hypothetical protein